VNDWVKIYSSAQPYKCNIVKALLDEYKIPYRELDKKDSTYTIFGEIELYVLPENEIFARLIITQRNLE
jgi:hypothetical protein